MSSTESQACSFLTVDPGTPVVDRFGQHVGRIEHVLTLEDGDFDGIIVHTRAGRRFVDAPEVRRISRGTVTLGVTVDDVVSPGVGGHVVYGMPEARHGRKHATEADRDEVINRLKRAYVDDELTVDELGERISVAHVSETLEQLDGALAGLRET